MDEHTSAGEGRMAQQFDALAAAYEAFATLPFRQHLEAHTVFTALGDLRGLRVLDYGCGTGTYARWIKDRGAAGVAGFDLSAGMLAHARESEAREPRGIDYHLGTLPASTAGTFDLVLAVYVLPYASTHAELTSICANAARALRADGRFVTLALNPAFHPSPTHYTHYGFELRAERPLRDGDEVRLDVCPPGHHARILARYWSEAAMTDAMRDAGLTSTTWTRPSVSVEGLAGWGADFWENYLTTPHALVLEGRR